MSAQTLEMLIDRYCAAWNTQDAGERRAILKSVLVEDGLYVDPSVRTVGPEALAVHIDGVVARNPGARISRTGAVDAHHDVLRFAWNNRLASGTVLRQGIDFCMLAADGRFQSIAGFLEPTSN